MKRKNILLFALAIGFMGLMSCEDEKTESKPYFGKWKSGIYPTIDTSIPFNDTIPPTYILEQMTFDFTNDAFTDEIARSTGVTDLNLKKMITFGGDIDNSAENILDVSVQTLSIFMGATTVSGDRQQEETNFNTLFTGSLGTMLDKDFSATYEIYSDGDSMRLSMPTKLQAEPVAIRLGKME